MRIGDKWIDEETCKGALFGWDRYVYIERPGKSDAVQTNRQINVFQIELNLIFLNFSRYNFVNVSIFTFLLW